MLSDSPKSPAERYLASRPERLLAKFLLEKLESLDRPAGCGLSSAHIDLVEEIGKEESTICILLPDDSGFTVTVKRVKGKK